MELFWNKKARYEQYKKDGRVRLAHFRKIKEEVRAKKDDGVLRQSELWSLPSLDTGLTKEYKDVSSDITFLIKQDLALENYTQRLDTALYRCDFGKCEAVGTLLKVDPLADVSKAIPVVNYETGEVIEEKAEEKEKTTP